MNLSKRGRDTAQRDKQIHQSNHRFKIVSDTHCIVGVFSGLIDPGMGFCLNSGGSSRKMFFHSSTFILFRKYPYRNRKNPAPLSFTITTIENQEMEINNHGLPVFIVIHYFN